MVRCLHCAHAKYCRKHWRVRLVHRDTLHPALWINQYIQTYYRPENMPWKLCVKSVLFEWNNEMLNVWSHLLGIFYIGFMQYWCAFKELPRVNAPLVDYAVMAGSMTCSQICLVLSVAYHTFGCQSVERRILWLKADLFGVSLALLGIYLCGIYTSFYRFPDVQKIYASCMPVIIIISLSIPFYSSRTTENMSKMRLKMSEKIVTTNVKHDTHRAVKYSNINDGVNKRQEKRVGVTHLIYIALALFGLYPTWHWIELHGGLSDAHVREWLPTLITLFVLLGMAFMFYATLIPERFFPGKFDVVGCSHQWWHILILAAMIYWHSAGVKLLIFYHSLTYDNDPQHDNFSNQVPNILLNTTLNSVTKINASINL